MDALLRRHQLASTGGIMILGYNNDTQFIRAFGQDEWLKTRGLEGWLALAIDKLEEPARQRIANEIEAHYAEAVSAHTAAGEPEVSAQAAALAELGDPQTAALNFQKSHLTETEAKSMQQQERTAAKPLFSFRMMPFDVIPVVGFVLLCSHANPVSNFWLLVTAVLMAYVGFRLIPRLLYAKTLPRISFLQSLALSNFLGVAAAAALYTLFFYMRHHDTFEALYLFLYIFLLFGCFKSNSPLRIWIKLRKMSSELDELPPQRTISS
jgi:hypothetical protein